MLSPATPLVSVILPACTIAYKSDQAIYHSQPILYVLMFGFIAAKITNRLVVSRRSKRGGGGGLKAGENFGVKIKYRYVFVK